MLVIVALAVLLAEDLRAASSPTEHYSRGLTAARAGKLEEALRHFSAARDQGMDAPTLTHNLGVVNFKLGRLDAAATAFQDLTGDTRWRALAHYNLGLIEERRGRTAAAVKNFRRARSLATSRQLRALAERKLSPAIPAAAARPSSRWYVLASLAAGYDDNVVLADHSLLDAVSDEGDEFGEILAAAQRALGDDGRSGFVIDFGGYYRKHADLDDFDFAAFSAALHWRKPLGAWRLSTGFKSEAQFAGGESYANVATVRAQLEDNEGPARWRLRNDFSYLSGSSDFDFVTGWRNRVQLQVNHRVDPIELEGGYEIEVNDRDDLTAGSQFFSYSPLRHRVYGALGFDFWPKIHLNLRASLRLSDYEDDNRFFDDNGDLIEAPRDQDALSLTARIAYTLGARWRLWSQYQYNDSDSDIPRYQYASNAYLLGLETAF